MATRWGFFWQNRNSQSGNADCSHHSTVNIRFTSSLTPEDENLAAAGILKALTGILDLLPIAYTIRIDTSDSQVYQYTGSNVPKKLAAEPPPTHLAVPSFES